MVEKFDGIRLVHNVPHMCFLVQANRISQQRSYANLFTITLARYLQAQVLLNKSALHTVKTCDTGRQK